MKKFLFFLLLLTSITSISQVKDSIPLDDLREFVKVGDTITLDLKEVELLRKPTFNSQRDVHFYYWFRKKVFKAYPYAILAAERLDSLNVRLSKINNKRKKKKYIKIIQRYLEGEFTDQLKKMTKTEGRILIKLIHRQTGKTVYQHIKEFKSGWNAFWYNTTANLFSLSLKLKYNPAMNNEDFLIEDVLRRAYAFDQLKERTSFFSINYNEIFLKNKGIVNVEVYKKMFEKLNKKRKRKANN